MYKHGEDCGGIIILENGKTNYPNIVRGIIFFN
jgi:hypothetical protein